MLRELLCPTVDPEVIIQNYKLLNNSPPRMGEGVEGVGLSSKTDAA